MQKNILSPSGAAHVLYEIDGHLYTTFVVARLVGMPIPRSLELAWGCQVPDANKKYTAVSAAWRSLWKTYELDLMRVLHSIHGGKQEQVRKRREDLKQLITEAIQRGDPDWRTGLMIHAYGDSFAHTFLKMGEEHSYEPPFGHAGHGHKPDKIGNFPEKYLEYVAGLYAALGGQGDPPTALDGLIKIVENNDGNNSKISSSIATYAAELGMTDEGSDSVRDRLLKDITEKDVVETMAAMEARFAKD
ncbi:hypothetical protein [Stenotrophomonas maltophilia]|uniref:hypothetical protein n=1 Tax=Stenotrophomonas maltophilia TaxID=40324 RepID=UPI0039C4A760